MNQRDKISIIIIILSFISGIIESSYSIFYGNPNAASAWGMLLFPIIMLIFLLYQKFAKSDGMPFFNIILYMIVTVGAWFAGGMIMGLAFL